MLGIRLELEASSTDASPDDHVAIRAVIQNITDTYVTYNSNTDVIQIVGRDASGRQTGWSPICPNARPAVVVYASLAPGEKLGAFDVDYPGDDPECRLPAGEFQLAAWFAGCSADRPHEDGSDDAARCDREWTSVTASLPFRQR